MSREQHVDAVAAALIAACPGIGRPPPRPGGPVEQLSRRGRGGGIIVCRGVTIGTDTVVGAGPVVVGDPPADAVAVGSPARTIRTV
jgi:hypothetical protein